MPKVSVVVPAYNAAKYLRRCLDSLAAQTLADIEVLMVNDGSTDAGAEGGSTLDIMGEYAARDARFILIDKPNTGYGDNINIGFARATGDYLAILESDDFAEPDFLETLYDMCVEHDLDVARCQFSLYWSVPEERDEVKELFAPEWCGRVLNPSDPALPPDAVDRQVFYLHPAIWSAIYRASFIRRHGIVCRTTPGASFQDVGFNFKVWMNATRVMLTPRALVHYRQDNEASSINNPKKVFMVCGEYDEIHRWLAEEEPQLREVFEPVVWREQFNSYYWNFHRLTPELRRGFVERMQADLVPARWAGLLPDGLYTPDERRMLTVLEKDADLFCRWRSPLPADAGPGAKLVHRFVTLRALMRAKT